MNARVRPVSRLSVAANITALLTPHVREYKYARPVEPESVSTVVEKESNYVPLPKFTSDFLLMG